MQININANNAVAEFIKGNNERINQSLYILSTIRKLERTGDQCKNIAEEIIFYIEAKVLKHVPSKQIKQSYSSSRR
jgi:phosphate transport system protein